MKTRQVNLRMSKDLLKDLDKIAEELHISKAEWIKIKLAEAIYKTKKELRGER